MYLQGFFSIYNLSNLPFVKSNIGSDTEKLYMHRARVHNFCHVALTLIPIANDSLLIFNRRIYPINEKFVLASNRRMYTNIDL